MADKAGLPHRIRYGRAAGNDCRGELTATDPFLAVSWSCGSQGGTLYSRLAGDYNLENILAAACVGNYFGVESGVISAAIEAYVPTNSRSQLVEKGGNRIVLDAYNANPTSMTAALKNFAAMEARRKIVFLGGMAELGDDSEREHQALAGLLDELAFDEVVLVGPQFRNITMSRPFRLEENAEAAAALARSRNYAGATILIKGSRSSHMEKVFEAL
jgi:UDP-N-acetylmuramoyl-tripeptide--D-alanyl-D-alanine ligase